MTSLFRRAVDEFQIYLTEQNSESPVTPTLLRVRILSAGIAIGHLLFGFLMTAVDPQPFENMSMRAGLAAFALLLTWQTYSPWLNQRIPSLTLARSFTWSIWLHLDLFSLWMYAMNGCNAIWLAYSCTSIMMSFLLMKWRLALNGLSMSLLFAPLLAWATGRELQWPSIEHVCTLSLAVSLSLFYALAMGNAREQHLRQSLAITGLLQMRMRPNLLNLRQQLTRLLPIAEQAQPAASAVRLKALHHAFGQSLNHIEYFLQLQRNNAQMLGLSAQVEQLDAQELLAQVLDKYPYRSPSERRCIELQVENNFHFLGNRQQWQQALSNILQNALDSLHHTKLHHDQGDLCCYIRTRGSWGRISIQDHGLPISEQALPRVFEPFYSDGPAAGLGLGLPFCLQLAQRAGGRMGITSDALDGTVVHIYLPQVADSEKASSAQRQNRGAA